MANMTFGVNILPKANAHVSIGNSDNPWTIVSPELTGTPTAPTAASGTDNTQIATTAFVNDAIPGAATQSADGLMSSSDKTKLDGVATGATANVGTITGINMNGASKGTSGVVDLGTIITAHQDISGKLDTANVYNGLDKADAGFALDARQGKILNDHFGAYGYGTCATAAATTAKAATLSNYELRTGSIVAIRFTYAVPASATLNVNSKGAKAIRYRNAAIAANIIRAGDTATFVYNGTYYHLIAVDPGNMTWGQLCST